MRKYYVEVIFFEIIRRKWTDTIALLFSTVLFVFPHWVFGTFDINLLFIFLYSVVFTLIYMECGLIGSSLTHMFVNFYLVVLSID